jgi:nitrite reductase/ring-hydroxylating ferredoxin subunit
MIHLRVTLLLLLSSIHDAFYVPIATSLSVKKTAQSIKLDSSTVVVARNSTGEPIAFHDYCPHRGASFDTISLKEDTISCPYHGFIFDTPDGTLKRGTGVKPGCASLKMIDCIDRSGLVWANIDGDKDVCPPPEIPEASDPTYRKITGSVIIKCPVEQFVENVLDSVHVGYVHSFGNNILPEPLNYKAKKINLSHGFAKFQYNAGTTSMFSGMLDVYNWYHIGSTAGTSVKSGNDTKIVQVHAVQLPGGEIKVFWELYRNWLTNQAFDFIFESAMYITLKEDKDILERCSFKDGDKINGKYDKLQLLYRKSMISSKEIRNADNLQ